MTYHEAVDVQNAIRQWHHDWQIHIRTSGLTNSANYTLEIVKGQKSVILTQPTEDALRALTNALE